MSRSVEEWIGKTDDSAIPPRVRVRIFDKYEGQCQCGCNRKIMVGEAWDCEDAIAIINGGQRRESNLRPFLRAHHPAKTAQDVAIKSKNYKRRSRHLGIERSTSRPIPGSKASGIRKRMNGTVERRS